MSFLNTIFRNRRENQQRRQWQWFARSGGLLAIIGACALCAIQVPASISHGSEVSRMTRPAPDALAAIPVGQKVLIQAMTPSNSDDTRAATTGLGVFVIESRPRPTGGKSTATPGASANQNWQRVEASPAEANWKLLNDAAYPVQLTSTAILHNARRVTGDKAGLNTSDNEFQFSGYLPGQLVTIEGVRAGDVLLAEQIYPGSPDEYVQYLTVSQPFAAVRTALLCATLGAVLLVAGWLSRLLGLFRLR